MSKLDRLQQQQDALSSVTKEILAYVEEIVDPQSFVQMNAFSVGCDRVDGTPILGEGVLVGTATVGGISTVIIAQNQAALMGSFGRATADKICRALDFAIANSLPVISVLDSAGARVGEGVEVLEGYGAVLKKVIAYRSSVDGVHFAVVKGQAVGMMSVYASSCDYVIAHKDAVVSVTAPAVLAAQSGKAAKDLVGAEALASKGAVDFVCADVTAVAETIEGLLCWHYSALDSDDDPNRETPALAEDVSTDALLEALADEGKYIEYRAGVAGALRCAYTYVNGTAVGVVASAGGNVDLASSDKMVDFLANLARAGAPLVTLVNADGFADADVVALNDSMVNLAAFLEDVPVKIAVCVGHAVGSAYVMLASKGLGYDYSVAFADAVVSPVAPEAAVHLVYADVLKSEGNTPEVQAKLAAMYADEQCDAFHAAALGYVDEVIHPATLRPYVANALYLLCAEA